MITLPLIPTAPPIALNAQGTYTICGTRVTLQTVVGAYQNCTPEKIVACYPVLKLADVHATIAYYLQHQKEVDAYIVERERYQAELREQASPSPTRPSLEARRSTNESEP